MRKNNNNYHDYFGDEFDDNLNNNIDPMLNYDLLEKEFEVDILKLAIEIEKKNFFWIFSSSESKLKKIEKTFKLLKNLV